MVQALRIDDLHKSFGAKQALTGVSFNLDRGEILAVLGPSGCGKSTLLNIIAGLEAPDQGQVFWEDRSMNNIPPYQRGFGLMFQDFALFPHQNVFENIAFGLRMQRMPKENIDRQVAETLELVGLPGYAKRDVNTLSGGEQQRIALARALAPRPHLLMLDEPLGSLDRTLRERLVLDLRAILGQSGQTAIYVTHDQEEAFTLADRVVVMNSGRIEQIGSPEGIYQRPATRFVAAFLGLDNLLPATVLTRQANHITFTSPIGQIMLPMVDIAYQPGDEVIILLRPDALHPDGSGSAQFEGKLVETIYRGGLNRVTLAVQDVSLVIDIPSRVKLPALGEMLVVGYYPDQAVMVYNKR